MSSSSRRFKQIETIYETYIHRYPYIVGNTIFNEKYHKYYDVLIERDGNLTDETMYIIKEIINIFNVQWPLKTMEAKESMMCIPSSHFVHSSIIDIVDAFSRNGVEVKAFASNRVDFNRSLCMDYFLKSDKELLFMLDSDVLLQTPFKKTMEIVNNDLDTYDIVLAPLFSPAGRWLTMPDPPSMTSPYEVVGGSLGFMALKKSTAKRLTPVGYYQAFGSGDEYRTPLFFRYTEVTSEDSDFIARVRGQKMRIVADPKIRVAHLKFLPIISPSVDNVLMQIVQISKVPARLNGNVVVLDIDLDKTIYINGVDIVKLNETSDKLDGVYVSSMVSDIEGVVTNTVVDKKMPVNDFIKLLQNTYKKYNSKIDNKQ